MGYVLLVGLFALIVYEIISTIKAIKKRKIALKKREEEHNAKLKENVPQDEKSQGDVNEK